MKVSRGVLSGIALGVIVAGAGYIVGKISYLRSIRAVAVDVPCVVMEVGDSESVKGTIVFKIPGSWKFNTMNGGDVYYRRNVDYFSFRGSTSKVIGKPANPTGVAELVGDSPGEGTLEVWGVSPGGNIHKGVSLPIKVVKKQNSFTDYFALAAKVATKAWCTGGAGNFIVNVFGGQGLCDHWADWMIQWIKRHQNKQVCRIEKALFGKKWHQFRHVCVRIELCDDGVYYFDPHKHPKNPVIEKEDYEKKHGKPYDVIKF